MLGIFILIGLCTAVTLVTMIWFWRTQNKNLAQLSLQEEWQRSYYHVACLCVCACAFLFGYWLSYFQEISYFQPWLIERGDKFFIHPFTEFDGIWHQSIVRDVDFSDSSHPDVPYLLMIKNSFFGYIPTVGFFIFFSAGFISFLYAKMRLPYFANFLNLPYLAVAIAPLVALVLSVAEIKLPIWLLDVWYVCVFTVLLQVLFNFSQLLRRRKINDDY